MARVAHFRLSAKKISELSFQGVAVIFSVVAILLSAALMDISVQIPLMLLAAHFVAVWAYSQEQRGVREIVLALFFALFITTLHGYRYEDFNLAIGWVNLYPLLLWTAALVLFRQLCRLLPRAHRFLFGVLLYICTLFALEAVGFYVLGIHSVGGYPSLLGLGVIHGPPIIHWFYVTAGPLYVWVAERMKL